HGVAELGTTAFRPLRFLQLAHQVGGHHAREVRAQLVAERALLVAQLDLHDRSLPPVAEAASGSQARPRIKPLVGQPVPAVTSACSTPGTWLHDVPRICRTHSVMPFMPWMYASPRSPPLVLIGSSPPIDRRSTVAKSFASPRWQKPSSSSCTSTNGVKWS